MKIKILTLLILIIALIVTHFYPDGTSSEIITESLHANKPVSMASGKVLTQVLNTAGLSTIKEIQIRFGTYKRKNTGTINVALYEDDTEIAHMEYPMEKLVDNSFQSFKLNKPVEISESAQYVVKISEEYKGKNTVAVWTNNGVEGTYKINNDNKTGSICYKLVGNN